ncbi:MAG: hypothetical protein JST37_10495 [Bacteroidetes bacterium]|nr:hypothetical protein [Bacteroidota bacterium]
MKFILTVLFATKLLICIGQTEVEFINIYNDHLDPKHKLDSINKYKVTLNIIASGTLNSMPFNSDNEMICEYFANGDQKCRDGRIDREIDNGFFPSLGPGFKNSIKNQLDFITTWGDSVVFSYKIKTDTVTIIEKKLNSFQKFIYTFDSKSKDLLKIENCGLRNKKYYSITKFNSYQNVMGIIVPHTLVFSNYFCKASVEYRDISFDKSLR